MYFTTNVCLRVDLDRAPGHYEIFYTPANIACILVH